MTLNFLMVKFKNCIKLSNQFAFLKLDIWSGITALFTAWKSSNSVAITGKTESCNFRYPKKQFAKKHFTNPK